MRKTAGFARIMLLTAAAGLVGSACLLRRGPKPFPVESRQLGVVMPFHYKSPEKALDALPRLWSEQLTLALFDTKRMRVIDPGRLEATMRSMGLKAWKPVNASTVAVVATKLRAETAVFGTILEAERLEKKKGEKITETVRVSVEAKLVRGRSTEVLAVGRAEAQASKSYKTGRAPPTEVLINKALSSAARRVARELVEELQPLLQ